MREELAELCHEQWSGWMKYLFDKCAPPMHHSQGGIIIPPWAVERWKSQMNTPYEKLSDEEKESDRAEADRFIAIFNSYNTKQSKEKVNASKVKSTAASSGDSASR